MFDEFLAGWGNQRPFTDADYVDFVDGKPRTDGVRSFLHSRGIELPEGEPDDPPSAETVTGLGARKNLRFNEVLQRDGVIAYPGSVTLLDRLADTDLELAIVSSSRNARQVLDAAGLLDRFEVIVDGNVGADAHLPGKPAPDFFLHATLFTRIFQSPSVGLSPHFDSSASLDFRSALAASTSTSLPRIACSTSTSIAPFGSMRR